MGYTASQERRARRSPTTWFVLVGSGLFAGTKLHGTFGKGIKEPSVYDQSYSLLNELEALPAAPGVPSGAQVVSQYHITQVGAENSRTFDGGVDQQMFGERARIGVTYFHDELRMVSSMCPRRASSICSE